jgi:hypothetical protein
MFAFAVRVLSHAESCSGAGGETLRLTRPLYATNGVSVDVTMHVKRLSRVPSSP